MQLKNVSEYIRALSESQHFAPMVAVNHYVPGEDGVFQSPLGIVNPTMSDLLQQMGMIKLYRHQVDALNAISNKNDIVVTTPTASGKTFIYSFAAIHAFINESHATSLFLYPLKALAQDQLKAFTEMVERTGPTTIRTAIYDGDTNAFQRKKIRQQPPDVLITNPDMLHLGILPHHPIWESFLNKLRLIVIDEAHTYRGVLGSHVAQIIRRLRRLCTYYGANPNIILTSATMANAAYQAGQLTGLPVKVIDQNGAPKSGRHYVLMDPIGSGPANIVILLLKAAMARGLRTIVYSQSRKMAELITLWARNNSDSSSRRIAVYRAGFLPNERRKIEDRLKNGELLSVISTSALESGIDIGYLDICLLIGYPGSMISTQQRTGRVGRKGQASALILIAGEDALDKYYLSHPEAFWSAEAETIVVNPFNKIVLASHLACAAAELPLAADEPWLSHPPITQVVFEMEQTGRLRRNKAGNLLFSQFRNPHKDVPIRSIGKSFQIIDFDTTLHIGQIDAFRLYYETHPGAVYIHQTKSYLIHDIDEKKHVVHAVAANVDYYTKVRTKNEVVIVKVEKEQVAQSIGVMLCTLKITDQVLGYESVNIRTGRKQSYTGLNPPPNQFETQGFCLRIPQALCGFIEASGSHLLGSLHAAEHILIGMMPLLVLADRNDIGGLSSNYDLQTGSAVIYLYDGVPGGAGFSEEAFYAVKRLIKLGLDAVDRCDCKNGCPGCTHSPKCGSGNQPIDKSGARHLLSKISVEMEHLEFKNLSLNTPDNTASVPIIGAGLSVKRFGVLDIETQYSAEEVGGWHRAEKMKISCAVLFDSIKNEYAVYLEEQIEELINHLFGLDYIVGFNIKEFDYRVLSGYSRKRFADLRTYDLLEQVRHNLGYRLSLNHLAEATLDTAKSGSGLDALRWWREGRVQRVINYCREDVRITKELFLYSLNNGYLLYRDKAGELFRVPMKAQLI